MVNTDVVFRLILRKHVSTNASIDNSGNNNSSFNVLPGIASQNNESKQNLANLALTSPNTRRNSSSFGTGTRQSPAPPPFDSTQLFADIAALKTETEGLKRSMSSLLMKNSQKDDPTTVSTKNNNNSIEEISATYESRIFSLEQELKEARELLSKQQSH